MPEQGEYPRTTWTKIKKAADPGHPECRKSMEELVVLYDNPLRKVFEFVLHGNSDDAMDWKQDFVVDHLLNGKIFKAAKPLGHFRTFLAVAIRNYVLNRLEENRAQKRAPGAGAKPFSGFDKLGEKGSFEVGVVRDREEDYLRILTRARAWDIYNESMAQLELWCRGQVNCTDLLDVVSKMRSGEIATRRGTKQEAVVKQAINEFKIRLRKAIREELLVEPGEDEEIVAGREIAILLDSLGDKGSEVPSHE